MLLKTRFYLPPLREQSVYRSSLLTRLNQSAGGQLVVIAAPAGYGKSTLLSQWLHHFPHTFSWLTLDHSHNNPLQFWRYILNALQSIQPTVGVEAKRLIEQQRNIAMPDIVISLLNDLDQLSTHTSSHSRSTDAISLVLDDFHLLENQQLLVLVNLFLDHLPPGIRLVITSREEPPLALAKRRASNQLIELTSQDLAFNLAESQQFFANAMALELDENTVAKLLQGTEGWVAGLQLAALSLKSGNSKMEALVSSPTLDRHIEDYLFEEVFAHQAAELQAFLVHTALVPQFCASLANSITDTQNGQQMLLRLEQANLFLVPLDNHRTWYRYHDLFRQFLLQQFQSLSPATRIACQGNAALWYEQFGYPVEAIEQYLECQQWDSAIALIRELTPEIMDATQFDLWCDRFPPSKADAALALRSVLPASAATQNPLPETATTSLPGGMVLVQGAEPLTQREKEVLTLVTQGLTNKAIAEQLHISLNTLKVHIRNLYGKIGVENRTQALIKMGTTR